MNSWETGFEPEDIPPEPLLFCPRCETRPELATKLCPFCGERGLPQGYCSVCEQYWRLPLGAACPKHDLPLDGPPVDALVNEAGDSPTHWVTIGRFPDGVAASVARGRLEAEGIPTFVAGERMGNQSMYLVATGGVMLQVPRSLTSDARILLNQTWEIPEDPDNLDDAWDELAPTPGQFRRTVMKGVIVLILVGPAVLTLVSMAIRSLTL